MWSRSLSAFLVAAALSAAERYQASEPHMGTVVTITLYADSPQQAQAGFLSAFGRIAGLDAILSDYKPDSELSRVCQTDAPLSPELSTVLAHAQRLAEQTRGAFDVTAGPLIRLWRKARSEKRLPDQAEVASALVRSGYRKLALSDSGRRVRCLVPGMQLDAGGIAKGYAADEALAALRRAGISSALVAVSGDVAAAEAPPGRDGWRVQVQNRVFTLVNSAVSTSGDESQGLQLDGVRYSHILDPRTGKPLRNSRMVSVIADRGIEADSLATALSVEESATTNLTWKVVHRHPQGMIVDARAPESRGLAIVTAAELATKLPKLHRIRHESAY